MRNDNVGQTPLSVATEKGHEVAVRLLVEKGAYVYYMDNDGRTSLSAAAEKGHKTVVKLLVENGVNIGFKNVLGGFISSSNNSLLENFR